MKFPAKKKDENDRGGKRINVVVVQESEEGYSENYNKRHVRREETKKN